MDEAILLVRKAFEITGVKYFEYSKHIKIEDGKAKIDFKPLLKLTPISEKELFSILDKQFITAQIQPQIFEEFTRHVENKLKLEEGFILSKIKKINNLNCINFDELSEEIITELEKVDDLVLKVKALATKFYFKQNRINVIVCTFPSGGQFWIFSEKDACTIPYSRSHPEIIHKISIDMEKFYEKEEKEKISLLQASNLDELELKLENLIVGWSMRNLKVVLTEGDVKRMTEFSTITGFILSQAFK